MTFVSVELSSNKREHPRTFCLQCGYRLNEVSNHVPPVFPSFFRLIILLFFILYFHGTPRRSLVVRRSTLTAIDALTFYSIRTWRKPKKQKKYLVFTPIPYVLSVCYQRVYLLQEPPAKCADVKKTHKNPRLNDENNFILRVQ